MRWDDDAFWRRREEEESGLFVGKWKASKKLHSFLSVGSITCLLPNFGHHFGLRAFPYTMLWIYAFLFHTGICYHSTTANPLHHTTWMGPIPRLPSKQQQQQHQRTLLLLALHAFSPHHRSRRRRSPAHDEHSPHPNPHHHRRRLHSYNNNALKISF